MFQIHPKQERTKEIAVLLRPQVEKLGTTDEERRGKGERKSGKRSSCENHRLSLKFFLHGRGEGGTVAEKCQPDERAW